MSDLKNDLPTGRQEKLITARGIVTESLPSTLFRVKIPARSHNNLGGGEDKMEEDKEILAYLSGKMRMHRIKVLIGDSVEIVLDPYGGKGRIIKRL
jgi:translation initiation factor IF-1